MLSQAIAEPRRTDGRSTKAHRFGSPRPLARRYLWMGVALGLGAPLGFALARLVLARPRGARRRLLGREGLAYAYMASTTPIVFGLFGCALGGREDRLRTAHAYIERLRAEFVAIVAHDLRDPIQAIGLQLELLLRHASGDEVVVSKEALERLVKSSERLGQMVNDLLDASRIEATRLRISPRAVFVPDAVAEVVEELRPTCATHALELKVEGRPPIVRVDEERLAQVVTNLVRNAAKHGYEGRPITVRVRPESGGVEVSVEDEGPGIPSDEIPLLFDRFHQGRRARQRSSGLGLGLYITKGLVEAHGGRVTVASGAGGSVFTAWFPGDPRMEDVDGSARSARVSPARAPR